MSEKILLVGCGRMGGALLSGWLKLGLSAQDITVVEPFSDSVPAELASAGGTIVAGFDDLPDDLRPDAVAIAVKPQVTDELLPPYGRFSDSVFLSIAAGRTLGYLAETLSATSNVVSVVRAMPNLPAAVGKGMTVAVAGRTVAPAQRALCDRLLGAVGDVAWVEDEALLDPVTALSGSGPAYVFLMTECLTVAGVEAGLAPDLAARLAETTMIGAAELMRQSPTGPTALREGVTSPGGTTQAALDVLMADDGLEQLMTRAVAAANIRSRELAG